MDRAVLRNATSGLLAGAAVLFVAAAWQRWWPACSSGGLASDACVRVQDHAYDYLLVGGTWRPVGHAAEVAGLALLLLAAAAVLLPVVLLPESGLRLRLSLAVAPAVSLTLLGVQALVSGRTGRVADVPLVAPATVAWVFVVPTALLLVVLAVLQSGPDRRTWWGLALAVALVLSTPGPVLLVLGPIAVPYASYDATPWSEALMAVPLLLAALLVRPATAPPPPHTVRRNIPAGVARAHA